jgi:putative thioredoxin
MRQDGAMQQSRNFSMQGAVDLGARQAAAKRRQQAAEAAEAGGGSTFVIEVTDATFSAEVVARSRSVPVIVDLWAEWCGPCKQLGPLLERLADEAAGAWVLAKVDVDANPQVSAALAVQSIPMVVAWIGGQPVDGFLGALPEPQVKAWIGQIMQAVEQLGMARVTGAAGAGAAADAAEMMQSAQAGGAGLAGQADAMLDEPGFKAAQDALDSGDLDGAAAALEQVLADAPGHPVAKAWLAQVDLFRRVGSYDQAKVRQKALERPDDPQAQTEAADVELATGEVEASFDRLLGVVGRTSGDDKNRARLHLLELFDILPPKDPRVTKARARLSSLLF